MNLVHYLFVVIVADGAAQLVVVHVWLSLPDAPEHGDGFRVEKLEFSVIANPSDDVGVLLLLKKFVEKLPELNLSWRIVEREDIVSLRLK